MKENLEIFLENPLVYFMGLILVGSYFFFKRKFENLADKDDIAGITREVESVKNEFNSDLEKLKMNLEILKSNKLSLINEKRKAIYDLWISLANLNNKLHSFFGVNIKEEQDCIIYCQEVDIQYFEFNKNLTVFEFVFLDEIDDEIMKVINDFMNSLMKKEMGVKNAILDLGKYKFSNNEKSLEGFSDFLTKTKEKVEILNVSYYENFTTLKLTISKLFKDI